MITAIYFLIFMAELESSTPPSPTPPSQSANSLQDAKEKVNSILQKLSKSEKFLSGGALLVVISSFLPAYTFTFPDYGQAASYYNVPAYNYSVNNLYGSIGWLNFLAAVAVLLLIGLPFFKVKLPAMPWSMTNILAVASGVAAVCSVIQILSYIFDGNSGASPSFGIFLVVAGSLLMLYTAYNDYKSHASTKTPPAAPQAGENPQG